MGGSSKQTTTSTSQATPYAPAQGSIDSILGQLGNQASNSGLTSTQSGAINTLESNASAGNPYAGLIGNAATGLLNGGGARSNDAAISGNLSNYQGLLAPYASGSMIGGNKALQDQLDTVTNDVSNQVNSQFAAAGRDGSPANLQALGRGIAQGTAPVIAAQYNQDVANQLNAANSLYGAGNTTYGLLNQNQQTANANQQAGAQLGSAALDANNWGANQLLSAEAQKFNIPTSNLTTLLGAISPVAQAFGTNNGTQVSQTQDDPLKTALSALIGGGTLLSKFSDRRLKQDVARVGALADGTPVYRYRYLGSSCFEIGLIAQDVESRVPEAVTEIGGFKAVDYGAATAHAARIAADQTQVN
jgi:Chaperone of endosialidase